MWLHEPYRAPRSYPAELLHARKSTVDLLGRSGLLLPTSVVVLEQPSQAEPPAFMGDLSLSNTRRHGRTRLSVYSAAP